MPIPFSRRPRARRRLLAAVVVATSAVFAASAISLPASAAQPTHDLKGSKPNWLAHAKKLGEASASKKIDFGILVGLRDRAAAEAELQAISDPSSASYGKWLTNAQFDAKYAPAKSDVAAVTSWLTAQHLTVRKALGSGLYIEVAGTNAAIAKAFDTTLNRYSYRGQTVQANASTLTLPSGTPASVVGAIGGVIGIDQGSLLKKPADTLPGPPAGSRYGVQPCSSYYGQKIAYDKPTAYGKHQPYAVCGYTPQQLQSAYGVSSLIAKGISGRGVTVAITDAYAAPTIYQDAQKYNAVHHQPLFKPGQFRQVVPASDGYANEDLCDPQGWYGEETLDVEAVHAMAPGANIVYVGGSDCVTGLDEAWAETIDAHRADIITNSWTDGVDDVADLTQAYIDYYTEFSLEAALTGITVQFSAGDSGDHTAGGTDLASRTVEFPADVPFVTGVGGTSVQVGAAGKRLGEYGWQNNYSVLTDGAWTPALPGTYSSGGGGGTSQLYAQPFYQRGVVPDRLAYANGSTAMRTVPDIAMEGDPNTGMIVGETQEFPNGTYWDQYRIGGTSLSSPLLAGTLAVAEQAGHRIYGFVNPLYYKLTGSAALHDIVAPTHPVAQVRTDFANFLDSSEGYVFKLQTIDIQSSTLHDTVGYDNETGVGTPNGALFALGLKAVARH